MIEDRIIRVIRAIVREVFPNYDFHGMYRYRVIQMASNRVDLQAVEKAPGLPDALPVPIHPGMAGISAELTQGSIVLVEFEEGDSGKPRVTHFSTKDDPGFKPVRLVLDATQEILLGGEEASAGVARQGDTTVDLLPPATFVGTIGGAPASGMVIWASQTLGSISTASATVKAK